MSDGPCLDTSDEARGVVTPLERDRLTRVEGFLRDLLRQTRLRLEGHSMAQVREALGVDERTARRRLRLLERLARKNINRQR